MSMDGFIPYKPGVASFYKKMGWWRNITLGDMFDKTSDIYPNRTALVSEAGRYSYAQLRRQVDSMAYNLVQKGLMPGERVFIQLPNIAEFVIAYFALQKAGLIMVPLTTNHTAREVSHLASLTRPKGWILPFKYRKTDFLPLIESVREENSHLSTVILTGKGNGQGFIHFNDLLNTSANQDEIKKKLEKVHPDPERVCQILPSGGTTGLPKGAPRTHNDYICNIEYLSLAWHLSSDDICLVASTVGHNLALLAAITGPVFHGARIVMMDSSYPEDFCRIVQDEKVSCTALVPTLISRFVNYKEIKKYDLSSLKKVYVGAANSPPELVRKVEKNLGCRYINGFGMVEGPLSQSRPEDNFDVRSATIGRRCCPYDDIITLDYEGKPTPLGVEGELAAKGPGIFTGYYKNSQANQDAFTPDGYFRTGDLAVIDDKEHIRITGRIKDIIIRGGENIAARDVEDLISSHALVEYVAAVGMPDDDLGEVVCVYIKPISGSIISHEQVIEHLEKFEAPKTFYPARTEIIEDLPLTAAGKADKKILKKMVQEKKEKEK